MMSRKLVLLMAVLPAIAMSQPAPGHSCMAGPYIVFFDADSSVLKRQAVEVLEIAIENAGSCGGPDVLLAGHSDVPEAPGIARDRALAVRNFLATRGIFVKRRNMQAFGATQLRMQAEGLPEAQNRRVEMIYGPSAYPGKR